VRPPVHAALHAPQWSAEVIVFTQVVPQAVSPF
jgi:hypothetical protein